MMQSLGDLSSSGYRLRKTQLPMPPDREGIVQEVKKILAQGQVQWVRVALGEGITYGRLIKADAADAEDPEITEDDLVYAARNAEVFDLTLTPGMNAFEYLFWAFSLLNRKGLKARALAVQSFSQISDWLKINGEVSPNVYGIDCIVHKDIPHGTGLLISAPTDSPETITYSIRLDMDLDPEDPPADPRDF